ncbi:MAG: hypothetical protein EON54_02775 [Alcaligenaceae bacterium]|nr:MAG: hypothetical protein EON54_02775 [Alcaligenaceae bacterium]
MPIAAKKRSAQMHTAGPDIGSGSSGGDTALPKSVKPPLGALPAGFVSPFKRVQMEERMDDCLACIAILTGKTMQETVAAARAEGYPAHGPALPSEKMTRRLLASLGGLKATEYLEFHSYDAMPNVALLYVDWHTEMEVGRHVVWHHVSGGADQQAFSYVIDPASWLPPERHYTTQFRLLKPDCYMEITQVPGSGKGKKA